MGNATSTRPAGGAGLSLPVDRIAEQLTHGEAAVFIQDVRRNRRLREFGDMDLLGLHN